MSVLAIANAFQAIGCVKEFIGQLPECTISNCTVNLIKKLMRIERGGGSDLNFQNKYESFTFFETFSIVLHDFHVHALQHLGLSEDYCLYHRFFETIVKTACGCPEVISSFPVLTVSFLPEIQKLSEFDSETGPIFSKFFDYYVDPKCKCGEVQKSHLETSAFCLVFQITYLCPVKILNLLASIPEILYPGDVFQEEITENYYLSAYFLASDQLSMHVYTKKDSFSSFLTQITTSLILPIGLIYTKQSALFGLEPIFFSHAEKKSKNSLIPSNFFCEISEKTGFSEKFTWNCEGCKVVVKGKQCSCGKIREINEWKCFCLQFSSGEHCKCGRKRPICRICKEKCEYFDEECKRCGGDYKVGAGCGLCGVDLGEICIVCYGSFEVCTICKSLNHKYSIACNRCMNPSLKLFVKNN